MIRTVLWGQWWCRRGGCGTNLEGERPGTQICASGRMCSVLWAGRERRGEGPETRGKREGKWAKKKRRKREKSKLMGNDLQAHTALKVEWREIHKYIWAGVLWCILPKLNLYVGNTTATTLQYLPQNNKMQDACHSTSPAIWSWRGKCLWLSGKRTWGRTSWHMSNWLE